jgi:hypothetical protein
LLLYHGKESTKNHPFDEKKTTQIMPWKPLQGDGGVGFMLTLSIAYLVSFM